MHTIYAELKIGCIPDSIHHMGFWKAEYQKFTFPASQYVFGGILPEVNYHTWCDGANY